jgi:hypothetical protein
MLHAPEQTSRHPERSEDRDSSAGHEKRIGHAEFSVTPAGDGTLHLRRAALLRDEGITAMQSGLHHGLAAAALMVSTGGAFADTGNGALMTRLSDAG